MVKRAAKNFIDFLMYGNFIVALSVLSAMWLSLLQWNQEVKTDKLAAFVFFATVFDYTLQRLLSIRKLKVEKSTSLMQWMQSNHWSEYLILFASGILSLYFFSFFPIRTYPVLALLAFPAILYAVPFPHRHRIVRLRETGLIKILTVAYVWAGVSVLLPWQYYELNLSLPDLVIPFSERFVLVLALILPFEMRDKSIDEAYQFANVAVQWGDYKTMRTAKALVISFFILEAVRVFPWNGQDLPFLISFAISTAITLYLIKLSKKSHHDYFYLIYLDCIPVLCFLLILLLKSL